MTENPPVETKVFISYSWSNPGHEAWVVEFAEELTSQGVHIILDKWDLQPGHDANAFMESMVADPTVTKVILVCDQKYAEKSDRRTGGAGTEAQIITPGLYARKDQDKFVAVVRENDDAGKAYLPVYYGSRIYIDLTNPATYSTEFDRLLRWIYDQPPLVRPERGAKPAFLSPSAAPGKINSAVAFRRASEGVRNSQQNAIPLVAEYLNLIADGLESFRVQMTNDNRETFDDVVIASIDEFLVYRNELIELFATIAQYNYSPDMLHTIHRFFERLIPYMNRPRHINSYHEREFDNFRFISHELFLYTLGSFLRYERFEGAAYLIDNEYYWDDPDGGNEKMHSYRVFREFMETLNSRNQRLQLNRLSLRADLLKDRNKSTGIDFDYLMAADVVLYLRSRNANVRSMWWPETLLYFGRFGGAMEMFARAKSVRYFDRIKGLLQVRNKEELAGVLQVIAAEPDRIPRWQHQHIDPARMIGFDSIATVP